jgi:hypothetical protein
MKQEWHTYGVTRKGISLPDLKRQLPQTLRDRLPQAPPLSNGICADAADASLVADLDRELRIGLTKDVIRWLRAEVDVRSVNEYEHYLVGFPNVEPVSRAGSVRDIVARTAQEFAQQVDFDWHGDPELGIRELNNWAVEKDEWLNTPSPRFPLPMNRIPILSGRTKDLFESTGLSGVAYVPLSNGYWMMDVLKRTACRADDLVLKEDDYDPETNSIGGTAEFGLRYERSDFESVDVQVVVRVETPAGGYRYRHPWLVASRRFLAVCLAAKVDRMRFPSILSRGGLVPLLVGRGRVTSTLQQYL